MIRTSSYGASPIALSYMLMAIIYGVSAFLSWRQTRREVCTCDVLLGLLHIGIAAIYALHLE